MNDQLYVVSNLKSRLRISKSPENKICILSLYLKLTSAGASGRTAQLLAVVVLKLVIVNAFLTEKKFHVSERLQLMILSKMLSRLASFLTQHGKNQLQNREPVDRSLVVSEIKKSEQIKSYIFC